MLKGVKKIALYNHIWMNLINRVKSYLSNDDNDNKIAVASVYKWMMVVLI